MIDLTEPLPDPLAEELGTRLERVRAGVRDASIRAGRPADDVLIVAVSKRHSAAAVQAAFAAGQRHFGESYVQEAVGKLPALEALAIDWHYIGRIQANKTRPIAERFHWVHTLDRDKTAARLDAQRPRFAPPLNVLIQVNLGDDRKGGTGPEDALRLAATVAALPRLRLRGLMSIPPAELTAEESRAHFDRMRELYARLRREGLDVDTLSMGMSHDFELAIEAGSNCVRIGTAIFGARRVA